MQAGILTIRRLFMLSRFSEVRCIRDCRVLSTLRVLDDHLMPKTKGWRECQCCGSLMLPPGFVHVLLFVKKGESRLNSVEILPQHQCSH
eukprot:5324339-Amphidinium_carterae.1